MSGDFPKGSMRQYFPFLLFLSLLLCCGTAFAAGGDPLWQLGDSRGGKQEAKASAADGNGDVIVTGYQSLAGGSDDFHTAKFKGDGSGIAWRATFDKAGGSDQATAVAVDSHNDVIVTGFAWSGRNTDVHTIKYSGATGEVIWQHSYNGSANGTDRATSVCVDANDNVYVAGYTQNVSGGTDFLLIKYLPTGPASGAPSWTATYHGSATGSNQANSVACGTGGIAVTGQSWNAQNGAFDFATVKYGYDGAQLWERRYSTATAEDKKRFCAGRYLRLDPQGNVVVTGSVSNGIDLDIYTAKLGAADGSTVWERTYNGAYDDEPYGVVIDPSGAVFVAGYTWTLTGTNDFYTARYDGESGAEVWGSIYDSGNGNDDITVATGLAVDPAGDVFVTGYTIAGGNYDFKTVKYKKDDGTQLWSVKFDGSAGLNDRPVGLGLSPRGEVLVSGWSDSDLNDLDYYVIKYDPGLLNAPSNLSAQAASNTSIRISFTDNSSNEELFRVERCQGAGCSDFAPVLSSGAPVTLPAHSGSDQVSYLDGGLTPNSYYSYRVSAANSANGESHYSNSAQAVTIYIPTLPPVWTYQYNGVANQEEAATAIAVGPDGNPVVTGYSRDYPAGYSAGASYDYVTLKLSHSGGSTPIWSARYNDPNTRDDFATCLAVDSSNGVTVSGYATLYNGVGADVFSLYMVKYSAGGSVLASDQYNGPVAGGASDDRSVAIASARDASGNVAVVGYGLAAAGNDNIYLLKYNADGSRAWAATPFDGAGGDDLPSAVAFAPDGSIYVTGYSERGANSGVYKLFTARYNGSTGALIWSELYSVTATGNNKGQSLAIDPLGNVYVTGSASGAAGDRDIYTIKYRGGVTSAQRIWERSADGAAHGDDGAVAVQIDPSDGNVVVAGSVHTALHDDDLRVIKYTPAGETVWDTTYFRPGTVEEARGMAIDSRGYVYLTGHTDNSDGTTIDAVTVRFNASGGIVGATIYNGAANGNDDSYAVAVNGSDEVFVAGYSVSANGKEDLLVYMVAPPEPRGLALASVNSTKADLSWSPVAFGESSFRVERCLGAGCSDFAPVGSAAAGATSYSDATLCNGGTYRYRIVAVGNGWESLPSAPLTVSTLAGQPPANLTVQASTESQVDLSWGDSNGDESGYLVERCLGAGCSNFSPLTTLLSAGTTSYSDTKLPVNTTYRYRVSALKNTSCSWQAATSPVSATTALLSPTGLTAQGENSTRVSLAWTNRTTTETGIRIERCTGVGCSDFSEIYVTLAKAGSYNDNSVCAGTAYSYRVRATNSLAPWDSTYSGTAATATPQVGNLLADSGFENGGTGWGAAVGTAAGTSFDSAVVAEGTRSLKLSASGAQLGRAQTVTVVPGQQYLLSGQVRAALSTGGGRCRIAGTGISSTGIGIAAASADNNAGWKSYSETVTIPQGTSSVAVQCYADLGSQGTIYFDSLSLALGSFPLSASEVNETKVALSWPDSASDESGYNILRCSGAGCSNFTTLTSVGANVTSFADSGLAPNTLYRYRVQPYKTATCGWSAASGAIAEATTAIRPPSGLTGSLANSTQANLSWTNNTATESAIVVEKCAGAGCTNYAPIALAARTSSWSDTFVAAGTTYQYRVRATNSSAGWDSGASNVVTVTSPALVAPTLSGTSLSDTQVRLNWTDTTSDESQFSIQRCTVQAGQSTCSNFVERATVPANNTYYYDTVNGVATYVYQVVASKSANNAWYNTSNPFSITPVPQPPGMYLISPVGTTQLSVGFYPNTTTQTAFEIERCQGSGCSNFTRVATLTASPWRVYDQVCSNTTYTYRARAVNSTVPWNTAYTPNSYGTTPAPAAPSALSATRLSEVAISLSWTRSSSSDADGYKVFRCTGASCTDFGATPLATVAGATSATYQDAAVAPGGTYQYKVTAYKSASPVTCPWETAATNTAQGTASLTPPSALSATALNSANVRLSWQDNTASETGFLIERCTVPNGSSSCSDFAQLAAQAAANAGASASFTDSTVAPSTTYLYRIRATSSTAAWTTAYSTASAPVTTAYQGPPSNVQATPAATKVTLTWADNTPDETGFTVYRCQGAGCTGFASVGTVGANSGASAGFTDNAVCGGITYRYQVVANRAVGDTPPSDPVSVTTIVPDAPALSATRVSEGQISLAWNDPTSDETGYRVQRCTGTGCMNFSDLAALAANTVSYADSAVMPGYSYSYRVQGYSTVSCGWQTQSPVASAVTSIAGPTALSAVAANSTQVNLAWSDSNTYTTGYRIERCTGAGCSDFRELLLTSSATPSYSDTGVAAGTTYRYRVRAARTVPYLWNSDYSQGVQVTTPAPAAPTGLSAAASSSSKVSLSWSAGSADLTGYAVEMCAGTSCKNFAEVARVTSATSYLSQGLLSSVNYCYRVRAYKDAGSPWYSGYTPAACAVTVVDAPTALSATAVSSMAVRLNWADSSQGEQGYNVEELLPSGEWMTVASLGADRTEYYDTVGISALRSYSYRVRAFSGSDYSSYSTTATVRTPAYASGDNTCVPTTTGIPTFTSTPVTSAAQNTPYSYQVAAVAAGGGSVSYTLTSKPAGMTISSEGLISWTPDYTQGGMKNVTVRASDAQLRSADQSFAIAVAAVDRAPVLPPIADQLVVAGHPLTVQAAASDPDGDTVSFTLSGAPAGMQVSGSGVISWTPAAPASAATVTVTASDGTLSASRSFSVTVNGGSAVSFSSTPGSTGMDGVEYAYQATVNNPDGYPLSYTLTGAPAGMTVSAAGRISWIPTAAQIGGNPVTLTVSDGVQQVSQSFTIQVAQNDVPYIRSAPVTSATTLVSYSYAVQAVSPAGGTLSYALTAAPSGMTITPAGVVTWTPASNQWGSFTVTVKASAGSSYALQSYTLKVAVPAATGLTPNGAADNGCVDWSTSLSWVAVPASSTGHTVQYAVVLDGITRPWQTATSYPVVIGASSYHTWQVLSRDVQDNTNQTASIVATVSEVGSCGGGSCPILYTWDGTSFVFESDLYGTGKLGLPAGAGFLKPNPNDYYLLTTVPAAQNGSFELRMVEERWETDYLDQVQLYSLDVAADRDVYAEIPLWGAGGISLDKLLHTVDLHPSPVTGTDVTTGGDISAQLSASDGNALMLGEPDRNLFNWHYIELDLGDLSQASQVKLLLDAQTIFPNTPAGSARSSSLEINKQRNLIQVVDQYGNWVNASVPMPRPKEFRRPYVIDITNAFLSNDRRIRLGFMYKTYIDAIAVDITADQPVSVNQVPLTTAVLEPYGYDRKTSEGEIYGFVYGDKVTTNYGFLPGNYTRFGDILPLLQDKDDMFALFGSGDQLRLNFTPNVPRPDGTRRKFLLSTVGYYKSIDNPRISRTVVPLPFSTMSNFPYDPAVESYPADAAHQDYLQQYNTRSY